MMLESVVIAEILFATTVLSLFLLFKLRKKLLVFF